MVKKIVGLQYEPEWNAPRVTVKATGNLAQQAIDLGRRQEDVRLIENPELAEALFAIPLESAIDDSLFEIVAILLVHIYQLDAELKKNF